MASIDELPDGHTLDIALKANDLPTYGTKAMKWARLQSGQVGKKKTGPKPKDALPTASLPNFETFSKARVPGLVALDIVDEDDQTTEIGRRWTAMNKAKAKSKAHVETVQSGPNTVDVRLDQLLDDHQLKLTGLTFVKNRLLKKCSKEILQMMCADFELPWSGSREQLADMLSEQLHAETDDEA